MGLQEKGEVPFLLAEQAEKALRTVIDAIPDELLVINRDYTVALANDKVAARLGGLDPVSRKLFCFQVHHGGNGPCHEQGIDCPHERVLETGQQTKVTHRHFDEFGNEIEFEITAAPLFDASGAVSQVVETCRDVARRDRRETENGATDEGRPSRDGPGREDASHGSPSHSVGSIAHDINNLMVGVLGNAELALEILPRDTPVRDSLLDVSAAARRAADLADELRSCSGRDNAPNRPASAAEAEPDGRHGDPAPVGKPTVLLVDDEDIVRNVAKNMIALLGYEVVTACDGDEALQIYKLNPAAISCVVLDLSMPKMDGEACLRELRGLGHDAKVVLSSGYDENELLERFEGKGLSGFIKKPYKMDQLRTLLRSVVT
jgi:CheY-like chemotaxis protein